MAGPGLAAAYTRRMSHTNDAVPTTPPEGPGALFAGFFGIGIMGFGGVLPLARRMMVERRRWLTGPEFTDVLALCQFLPGPNIVNVSIALGRRFHGGAGAAAALAGLLVAPVAIVLMLGGLYARWSGVPEVGRGFAGLAMAASGLVLANAAKIGATIRGAPVGAAVAGMTFMLVAVVRTPLVPTMLILAPLSVLLHRWRA